MLILAGVTLNTLLGEGGIIQRAQDSKTTWDKASAREELQLAVVSSYDNSLNIDKSRLRTELGEIGASITNEGETEWEITHRTYGFTIDITDGTVTDTTVATNPSDTSTPTPTPTPNETMEITGTITWNDNDDAQGLRPSSVSLKLMRDGEQLGSNLSVSDSDGWSYSFGRFPVSDGDGREYDYELQAVNTDNYIVWVEGFDVTFIFVLPPPVEPGAPGVPDAPSPDLP